VEKVHADNALRYDVGIIHRQERVGYPLTALDEHNARITRIGDVVVNQNLTVCIYDRNCLGYFGVRVRIWA
jgi:hypothetical protein